MLFEGYAAGMGYSLIGGGRYDNMMQRFGKPCPATGFALGIDRMALTLERQGKQFVKQPETDGNGNAAGRTGKSLQYMEIHRIISSLCFLLHEVRRNRTEMEI